MNTIDKHIVAIDLGTSKIALTVAKVEGNDVQIIYYRETESAGLRYSSIFNVKNVTEALSAAISHAKTPTKYSSIVISAVFLASVRYTLTVSTEITSAVSTGFLYVGVSEKSGSIIKISIIIGKIIAIFFIFNQSLLINYRCFRCRLEIFQMNYMKISKNR